MQSYAVARKIEVIERHRASKKNVSSTSRHFKIGRKRMRAWDSKYDALKPLNYGKQKMKRKLMDGGPVFNKELDDALFDYLQTERDIGRAVSNRLLTEEALRNLNLCNLFKPLENKHAIR
ncbi:hypothetical protein HPB49_006776 [Dermacentor silvarum]|uniref:Uncharacterized protein n=1 Tax=Dermacentor silvarum TaxID=543639 RepID=A0ACB8DWR6_DERSI|nr:hypothetical protein HPB49_006776 [Dermacentor silvarum]